MMDGDTPSPRMMAEANARTAFGRTVMIDLESFEHLPILAYDKNGTHHELTSTIGQSLIPARNMSRYHFTALNLTSGQQTFNNLGGMGPYNGDVFFLSAELFGAGCAEGGNPAVTGGPFPADRDCMKHPNYINFDAVGTTRDDRRISMRIDNVSVYEPANPSVNFFNGDPFQINLRPVFDLNAGQYADNASGYQPFAPFTILTQQGGSGAAFEGAALEAAKTILRGVLVLMEYNWRAENANAVNLYFQFYDTDTGEPVELEEVSNYQHGHSPELARTLRACPCGHCAPTTKP